jgi:NAD(P)H-flavin reductase
VNPIMSMLSAMDRHGVRYVDGKPAFGRGQNVGGMRERVRVLYSSKRVGKGAILFEERLMEIAKRWEGSKDVDLEFTLFETGEGGKEEDDDDGNVKHRKGRIAHEDLSEALGAEEEVDRERSVVYVCGVPQMTDEFVELLRKQTGMDERRVLCEKWW